MKIKIIKECNFPVGSIQDLGDERNERAVRLGLAKWEKGIESKFKTTLKDK